MRVGRMLEGLGYRWLEEPVQHYHVKAMGEVAQRLDITVSAGEQTHTLAGLADLIAAGVRMVQPDIVKMGGITGLMRCVALANAHGVELVPHQTQPMIGHLANLHLAASQLHATKRVSSTTPRRVCMRYSKIPHGPSTVSFTCRRRRDWDCRSMRLNWRNGACRSPEEKR